MGRLAGGFDPVSAAIVVTPDVRHGHPEGVPEESEIGRLEVAAADDRVEVPERLPIDRMVQGRVHGIGHGQETDRFAVPGLERVPIRPGHGQTSGHGDGRGSGPGVGSTSGSASKSSDSRIDGSFRDSATLGW